MSTRSFSFSPELPNHVFRLNSLLNIYNKFPYISFSARERGKKKPGKMRCPLQHQLLERSVFEWDATCCVLPYCLRFLPGARVTETLGTGTDPRHANSTPHLPGNPVANNSCPLRPYHTEYNYIVLLEMGNLIPIREGRENI